MKRKNMNKVCLLFHLFKGGEDSRCIDRISSIRIIRIVALLLLQLLLYGVMMCAWSI